MEYKIIQAFKASQSEFESMVNSAIEAGWVPVGGVSIATPNGPAGGIIYLQAMTRGKAKHK